MPRDRDRESPRAPTGKPGTRSRGIRPGSGPGKWMEAISFDGDLTNDCADALPVVGCPFETEMVAGFGQLKMSRWQIGGGAGMDGVRLRALRKIPPLAGRQNRS